MGLEAQAQLTRDGATFAVKALLESDALILRGGYRESVPRGAIVHAHVLGGQLLFEHGGRAYGLALPDGQADKWLKKLSAAPPSLAAKLGVDAAHRIMVHGAVTAAELDAALSGCVTSDPLAATQGLIVAASPEALAEGLAQMTAALPHAALWIVYPKGATASLPESAVRSHMRALGYVDTKTSAVSAALTAARYSRRKG